MTSRMDHKRRELEQLESGGRYHGYLYAYPHKTAYRPLSSPQTLRDVWRDVDQRQLFLYMHVPFCAVRCGFCNLFTATGGHARGQENVFLDALKRQATATRKALPDARFHRLAIGGGTPTFLSADGLHKMFDLANDMGLVVDAPRAVEGAPDSTTPERMTALKDRGTTRYSMGVQSFVEEECDALGRPQSSAKVEAALRAIHDAAFAVFNLDLIYGTPGQTPASWKQSLQQAVDTGANELFLYPLYVRELTGLDKGKRLPLVDDERQRQQEELYEQGRDFLIASGWEQVSMRFFRRHADGDAPAYSCQDDGMVGLGVGARSYTTSLHYSFDYAVGRASVVDIYKSWAERDVDDFSVVEHGFVLDLEEQRRRFAIQSLLQVAGVNRQHFQRRFGVDVVDALPELELLDDRGWLMADEDVVSLTSAGLARSDLIGPWLISDDVSERMAAYELR